MQDLDPIVRIVCSVDRALCKIKGIFADICTIQLSISTWVVSSMCRLAGGLSTSVSKNRHKMVYCNTSIQGLNYSTVLM